MIRESKIDWITLFLWLLIVGLGWLNMYSISMEESADPLAFNTHHGREALFIFGSLGLGIFIQLLDTKFLEFISYIFYGICIVLLVVVMGMKAVSGAASWIELGSFKLQPTEFAKVGAIMAMGRFMSRFNFSLDRRSDLLLSLLIPFVPLLLVVAQNDAGSALIFFGLIFVFYREGMHPLVLVTMGLAAITGMMAVILSDKMEHYHLLMGGVLLALAFLSWFFLFRRRFLTFHLGAFLGLLMIVMGVKFVLQPHQTARIRVLAASEEQIKADPALEKTYYNLKHSLVAIGSGGLTGKGFGQGTHTSGDFVPEEHTDYVFCKIGEEHGFLGSELLLVLFFLLFLRVIYIAENSKSRYARIFGYGVASYIFMHVTINIGMTIGMLPTIGIPLLFYSYGGSAMLAFSMMIFILMNHYSYRHNILGSSEK